MIRDQQAVVYWVDAAGELMLAPDTRMKPFRGMRRVECKTVGEIEMFSRQMARQQYHKMKMTRVEEHLRYAKKREQIKANCRLRLAQGCISPEDERLTRQTLRSLERKDELFYKMLSNEPDLSRSSLVIEQKESPIGMAEFTGKRRGLADDELNAANSLVESAV